MPLSRCRYKPYEALARLIAECSQCKGLGMPGSITRFRYIDAIRGYAILMVIAVHTSHYFSELSAPLATITAQGARGVQLFFVVSALSLCFSWTARKESAGAFYARRFFRIAPSPSRASTTTLPELMKSVSSPKKPRSR